mmetsp:Transcript_8872/g.29243  ORF Transcript_8872/g.29243 Transcript_8872/m.29243 type:complete len:358 (+) Transcript_8872:1106-2179(+)
MSIVGRERCGLTRCEGGGGRGGGDRCIHCRALAIGGRSGGRGRGGGGGGGGGVHGRLPLRPTQRHRPTHLATPSPSAASLASPSRQSTALHLALALQPSPLLCAPRLEHPIRGVQAPLRRRVLPLAAVVPAQRRRVASPLMRIEAVLSAARLSASSPSVQLPLHRAKAPPSRLAHVAVVAVRLRQVEASQSVRLLHRRRVGRDSRRRSLSLRRLSVRRLGPRARAELPTRSPDIADGGQGVSARQHRPPRGFVPLERLLQQRERGRLVLPVGCEDAEPVERLDGERLGAVHIPRARASHEHRHRAFEQRSRGAALLGIHQVCAEPGGGDGLDKASALGRAAASASRRRRESERGRVC